MDEQGCQVRVGTPLEGVVISVLGRQFQDAIQTSCTPSVRELFFL